VLPFFVHDNFVHDNFVHDKFVHDTAKKLVHDTGALRYPEILSKKKPLISEGLLFSKLVSGYRIKPDGSQPWECPLDWACVNRRV
jgi:hypothetical protein